MASNGSKVVSCVRCASDIQPYAGREVAYHKNSHHQGQCADQAARETAVRELAGQDNLFGWRCDHVEADPGNIAPLICSETSADRAEFAAHMASHGKRPLAGTGRIKLRKRPPAATLPKLEVITTKYATWTERIYGQWTPETGTPLLSETVRRGQFWSAGPDPHSFWYVPLDGSQPVTLYARGDGSLTRDWSEAKSARREINRRKSYRTAA
jgi:hypothetical protein